MYNCCGSQWKIHLGLIEARGHLLVMVMSPKAGVQLVRGTTSLWFACQQKRISKNVEARKSMGHWGFESS